MRKWRFRSGADARPRTPVTGVIFLQQLSLGVAHWLPPWVLRRLWLSSLPHRPHRRGRCERRLSPISVAPAQHSASFMRDEGPRPTRSIDPCKNTVIDAQRKQATFLGLLARVGTPIRHPHEKAPKT